MAGICFNIYFFSITIILNNPLCAYIVDISSVRLKIKQS